MRKIYLLLILTGFVIRASAQKTGSVKGVAFDTLSRQVVAAATITVLEKKDSSLVSFTMTDNAGKFELKGIPNGEYRLLITHVNYRSSNTGFTINDEKKEMDLGNIILSDKNSVLEEVVVGNEAPPITIIDDTLQYNAGSFKTQPNSNVEQLLKKLPGVKVEKDGTVKAQGETVKRILVDGKEFFGTDPKIATRNLPADAIDKVQVYDRQSDQAQLTGFEDGNYEKTINLKLKKDKKKGVFGKVAAGAGNKERYEGRFNVNSFKGARQMSAIGMGNNTNAEGFSFMDILNFSGGMSSASQGGVSTFSMSSADAAAFGLNGASNGGIKTVWGGGLNYNNIFGNNLDWQSNYFYNRYNPKMQSHVLRENILGNTSNFYEEDASSDNLNNSHRFRVNALYQIDSFHTLRFTPNFSYQQTDNRSSTNYRTTAANGSLINNGFSNSTSGGDGFNFGNDLLFTKKFRRRGRTFSLALNTNLNESDGNGNLSSIIGYYANNTLVRNDTLNQQNETSSNLRGYTVRAVYTEPVWRKSLLELSASKSNTRNVSEKTTYDYNKVSKLYDRINNQLTNNFENEYGYTNAGLRIRTQKRNFVYSLGVAWQESSLEGKVISGIKDSLITKTFRNFLPNASFKYNFSRFKSLSIFYATNTSQPSMSQLQPIPDITNPLNIKEGNPDLKQEYNHTFRTNLNLISPYKAKNLMLSMNGSITQNKIVNYDIVDLQTGVRRTRPVNVNGVFSLRGNTSYSMPVRFLKGTMEISSNVSYNNGKQFINMLSNNIKTFSLGPELRFDINPADKLNLGVGASYSLNDTKYSLQSSLNNKYLSQEYNAFADWQLPAGFFLASDFTYTINSQRAAGFNLKVPIWNASLSKQFLHYNRGELKLSAYDLLNRNTGLSRNTNQNYIEDKVVNTLRRFFLLTFTYNLTKTGPGNGGRQPGGISIRM